MGSFRFLNSGFCLLASPSSFLSYRFFVSSFLHLASMDPLFTDKTLALTCSCGLSYYLQCNSGEPGTLDLPEDLINMILGFLPKGELWAARKVHRTWTYIAGRLLVSARQNDRGFFLPPTRGAALVPHPSIPHNVRQGLQGNGRAPDTPEYTSMSRLGDPVWLRVSWNGASFQVRGTVRSVHPRNRWVDVQLENGLKLKDRATQSVSIRPWSVHRHLRRCLAH